ncbi:MAG: arginyl-tRNA synthetase [Amycolatopsis sp.]|uniref:arginine--tRNA ligase n=1 Tax=Amycolatopsis sp. TaxID=37632 RepID=UPI002616461A|nr:arginine--tRNA ligase [Amycolatopsis sp.]MCU1681193.1 arginyl-tRNA synthetase [Amycolatopsis sp.]
MVRGDVGIELGRRVAAALEAALGIELTPAETLIRTSSRRGADYQCNVAMSLGKKLGRAPREVAELIVKHLDSDDLLQGAEVAGAGFINLELSVAWLEGQVTSLTDDDRLGVAPVEVPRRIAIDYSSPNIAKEMHVGHIRSTVIGDSIARLLRFEGHEVIPHNHLGDWGTPFGMLIEYFLAQGGGGEQTISDLDRFYKRARERFDSDADFAELARKRVVLLQGGDEETLTLWRHLVDESTRHFDKVYGLLGIGLTTDDIYGESFYNPYLAQVVTELEEKGLTEISDGAVCVFPTGFTNREGDRLPLIIRKRDGGYGYAITDLATARYWTAERGATDLLYVVGLPQAQHFEMVFAVSRAAGWITDAQHAEHIGFGTVLGEDGKAMKTRSGETVKLADLLAEAVERATAVMAERSDLAPEAQADVARAVGIGAVKYADLSGDRERNYTFEWDRMLATEGNTSVYLQYANARIRSILRKAGREAGGAPVKLDAPAERELALKLVQFPAALASATQTYSPHKMCTYLYETATAFSGFFEHCPILRSEVPEDVRASRLALASLTSDALTLGMSLLGIEAPQQL